MQIKIEDFSRKMPDHLSSQGEAYKFLKNLGDMLEAKCELDNVFYSDNIDREKFRAGAIQLHDCAMKTLWREIKRTRNEPSTEIEFMIPCSINIIGEMGVSGVNHKNAKEVANMDDGMLSTVLNIWSKNGAVKMRGDMDLLKVHALFTTYYKSTTSIVRNLISEKTFSSWKSHKKGAKGYISLLPVVDGKGSGCLDLTLKKVSG